MISANKRPIPVLAVACVYVVVGSFGFVRNLRAIGHTDIYWIEGTEVLAVIAGIFMLRGRNWARWLALAWMGFHVALTLVTSQSLIVHLLIFVLIAWLLLRSESRVYFQVR
ncbi:MAG: hypothetical protein M3Y24_13545 [Acidobacteriota bacterium]|nr:hypothetical protein [Acidobacteriota bacterium]